jgi:Lon protease-like protein
MAMDLRLFPLQTVLFPGMRMPLHIFEERYRIMIRECLEEDVPFGVVLIKSGVEVGGGAKPCSIGTTARIVQVEYLDDGRMNLFTMGERRFRIVALNTTQPYLRGEVAYLDQQEADAAARAVMPHAQDLFDEYLRTYMALGSQWTRGVYLPEDPGEAADYIATRMDIPPEEKQELLEILSPEARLRRELEIIAPALPDMRARLVAYLRQKTSGFAVLN